MASRARGSPPAQRLLSGDTDEPEGPDNGEVGLRLDDGELELVTDDIVEVDFAVARVAVLVDEGDGRHVPPGSSWARGAAHRDLQYMRAADEVELEQTGLNSEAEHRGLRRRGQNEPSTRSLLIRTGFFRDVDSFSRE